jgi:hypothetical protein
LILVTLGRPTSRPQGIFVGPKGPKKNTSSPSLLIAWMNCLLDYVHCSFGSMQANISPTTSLHMHDEQTLYSKGLQPKCVGVGNNCQLYLILVMQTRKYLFLTKINRLVNCEMIVKTKPFQWPLISLHSNVKPKPFTK